MTSDIGAPVWAGSLRIRLGEALVKDAGVYFDRPHVTLPQLRTFVLDRVEALRKARSALGEAGRLSGGELELNVLPTKGPIARMWLDNRHHRAKPKKLYYCKWLGARGDWPRTIHTVIQAERPTETVRTLDTLQGVKTKNWITCTSPVALRNFGDALVYCAAYLVRLRGFAEPPSWRRKRVENEFAPAGREALAWLGEWKNACP
jgi:hypothetical protein